MFWGRKTQGELLCSIVTTIASYFMDQILSESRGFDPSPIDQTTSNDEHGPGDLAYGHLRMCSRQSKSFKILTIGY